jgi:segregation and condensation protein A
VITTEFEPTPAQDGYQVKLQIFEGPLDLLLFLIKKKKINIHNIPIAVITREYLEYLSHKERINLDREAEFLLMAALLIYIKSQMLLPREQPIEPDVDPRKELVDRLADYQKIKAACSVLREKEDEMSQIWKRTALTAPFPEEDLDLIEVSLFDLAESFFTLMKRKQSESQRIIKGKEISMAEKTNEIVVVLKERGFLDFLEYLDAQETLEEALIAFFCLLELIKARLVVAIQEQLFHTIKVWLRKDAPTLEKVNE